MSETKVQESFAEKSGTLTTPLLLTTEASLKNMMHISDLGRILEDAGIDLDSGQFFCLEPQDVMAKKSHEQLWSSFIYKDKDGVHLEIRRPDLKVCRGVMIWNVKGYWQFMMEEEPGSGKLGVGSMIIETRNGTMIKVWRLGPKGKIGHWAPKGGSQTRGEPVPDDAKFVGFFYSNFQRITGPTILEAPIPVYEIKTNHALKEDNNRFQEMEYNDSNRPEGFEELTSTHDFLKDSDDGRALATLAKVITSSSFDLYGTIKRMSEMAGVSFDSIAEQIQLNQEQTKELALAKQLFEKD